MQKSLLVILAAGMLTLTACQTTPTEPAKPVLSEEATKVLAQAEADVNEAGKAKGQWTTAVDALKAAKDAAAKGDSAETIKNSKRASSQAKLGIGQTKYPTLKIGD